jgi:hypothetical protein
MTVRPPSLRNVGEAPRAQAMWQRFLLKTPPYGFDLDAAKRP